jgi:hypothetical protein
MTSALSTAVPLSQSLGAGQRDTMSKKRGTRWDTRGTPLQTERCSNGLSDRTAGHQAGHLRRIQAPRPCTIGSLLRDRGSC